MTTGSSSRSSRKNVHVTFANFLGPNLTGLQPTDQDAARYILEFMDKQSESKPDKLMFLRAVETLSSAVCVMSQDNLNKYIPKVVLASKIENLILEEPTGFLEDDFLQRAMLCIVSLSQVHPPFYLSQKLDLVNSSLRRVFLLPVIIDSPDQEQENKFLFSQTIHALDEMIQALVLHERTPDMLALQKVLEILLPWLTDSIQAHEQVRAMGTISRLLRFICNFSKLLNMASFSISGKLMGTFGIFCMHKSFHVSVGASEALHYLLKILIMQRGERSNLEVILKELQKNFHGDWLVSIQDLIMFFTKYLTSEERADVILVLLEAMTIKHWPSDNTSGASQILKMIMKQPLPDIGKVQEVVQFLCDNLNRVTDVESRNVTKKLFSLLAQTYPDELILTLLDTDHQYERGCHKHWGILSSFPKGYEVVMNILLQRLISGQMCEDEDKKSGSRTKISPLTATKAIHQLLLESTQRTEVQTFYSSLFLALLFQLSFLVVGRNTKKMQEQQLTTFQLRDAVSSTMAALKTLMESTGYREQEAYIQKFGGWELLISPENHYEGVALLARAMVVCDCWHNRPIFHILVNQLKELKELDSYCCFMVLHFLTELFKSRAVVSMLDETTAAVLGKYFLCNELTMAKLLMQMVAIIMEHRDMVKPFQVLQPYVLKCCYCSMNKQLVCEVLRALCGLMNRLNWSRHRSFLTQLSFMLAIFYDEESKFLRITAFETYRLLLAKVKRRVLVFPFRYQVLNVIVILVLHLVDESVSVSQLCRSILRRTASILGWSKLKATFAKKNSWDILRALLVQEHSKALWFLKQSVDLFRSPQGPIRQGAVWFAGQIFQCLSEEESNNVHDSYLALKQMQEDPDPFVSCLAKQTLYILDAKKKRVPCSRPWCFCFCNRKL